MFCELMLFEMYIFTIQLLRSSILVEMTLLGAKAQVVKSSLVYNVVFVRYCLNLSLS